MTHPTQTTTWTNAMTNEALEDDGFGELGAAVECANTEWLRIARPIIKAMFAVEDAAHPVTKERLADPLGYASYGKRSAAGYAWADAQDIIENARRALGDMLDGIRDNAMCDHYVNVDYDGTEDAIAEQEAFNDGLRHCVISVDEAVKIIGGEND